jgi:hypothetical protein
MVRLVTARSPMEAKVLAARLGAEGFVWELRGSVDGPLAMGPIDVLVEEEDLPTARELLLLDEVEASFLDDGEPEPAHRTLELVVAAVVVALLVLFAVVRMTARV